MTTVPTMSKASFTKHTGARLRQLVLWLCAAATNLALAAPAQPGFTVERFKVLGCNPLSTKATDQALAPYLGEQQGIDQLQAAAKALEAALQQAGFGLYTVVLPPQDIAGSVRLQVQSRPVASIRAGDDGASLPAVRRALPNLTEGQTPNLLDLARSLELANENPARQLAVRFAESAVKPGGVDAQVDVQASSPWSATVHVDNSGGDQPAPSRLAATLTHANLWGLDHVATLSYTGSPEAWAAIHQYGLFYKAPIYPWAGSLSGYAFHSSSNSGPVATYFNVSGSGDFYGLSYKQLLLAEGDWRSSIQVGVDDKLFSDSSQFSGKAIGVDVRSRPISLGLTILKDTATSKASVSVSYVRNMESGDGNSDGAYAAARAGATSHWDLWRANADLNLQLPSGYLVALRGSAQSANRPLIGGEQFGIGGQDSVRALETRQVMGDSGLQGSVEIWLPPLLEGLSVLGFLDAGHITREQPAAPTSAQEDATAVGLGLRWQFARLGSLSIDYGYLLKGVTGTPSGHERLYASVSMRF